MNKRTKFLLVAGTFAPGGDVPGIILLHAFDPGAWEWCQP